MARSVIKPIYLALILLLIISACSTVSGDQMELTEEDAGKTIEMSKGGTLSIVLEGNPSTGYLWEVDSVEARVLKPVGEAEFKPVSDAPGSGGKVKLQFEAVEPGETLLSLIYHRPWEQDVLPEENFEVTVVVK